MPTLIDVVVPVRNGERHLPTFLASASRNSPAGCRYLVVDDGSTDRTPELLARAQRDLPQLTVTRLDRGRGVAGARNVALRLVSAPYLAFADVDDWSAPGRLEALVVAQRRTGAAVVRTDHVRVDGFRRVPQTAPAPAREIRLDGVATIGDAGGRSLVDYPFLWAGLFDTRQVALADLEFDESLRTASDRPWFWRLHLRGASVAVVAAPAYFYRRSAGSTSLTEGCHPRLLDIVPALHQIVDLAAASAVAAHRRRAAFTVVKLLVRHLHRRHRLAPPLQRELILGSARLLAGLDRLDLEQALRHVRPAEAEMATALRDAGDRWRS